MNKKQEWVTPQPKEEIVYRASFDNDLKSVIIEKGVIREDGIYAQRVYPNTEATRLLFDKSFAEAEKDKDNTPINLDSLSGDEVEAYIKTFAEKNNPAGYFYVPQLGVWSHITFIKDKRNVEYGDLDYVVGEVEFWKNNTVGLMYHVKTMNGLVLHSHSFEGCLELLAENKGSVIYDKAEFSEQELKLISALCSE